MRYRRRRYIRIVYRSGELPNYTSFASVVFDRSLRMGWRSIMPTPENVNG